MVVMLGQVLGPLLFPQQKFINKKCSLGTYMAPENNNLYYTVTR